MTLLGKISKGKIDRPPRVIVYGQAGVGKSTFASQWPDPLFIDAERRTEHLDVSRIEVDSWGEVTGIMGELIKAKEKPAKTIVFDTLDHIELMIHDHLCSLSGVTSIEDVGGGYGKGYTAAVNEWRRFVIGLEKLRAAGYGVLLLAHAHVKTFKNPLGEDYDKWQLKMNVKAGNFLREKADALGFAHFEDLVKEGKSSMDKGKGVTTGRRVLTFEHSAAFESKQGINLPDEIGLSYEEFKCSGK